MRKKYLLISAAIVTMIAATLNLKVIEAQTGEDCKAKKEREEQALDRVYKQNRSPSQNKETWHTGQEEQIAKNYKDCLNRKWRNEWYPEWKRNMRTIRETADKTLTEKVEKMSWYYNVVVSQDGTITDVQLVEKDSIRPKDTRFYELQNSRWMQMLKARGPAFPEGSQLTEWTMPVRFHNLDRTTEDVPAEKLPHEPELEAKAKKINR